MNKVLLLVGGLYNLGFVLFHLSFWKIFRWHEELRLISPVNRGIMQVLNIRLSYVFVVFAYVSIFHWEELISTPLGITILISISLFWFMRAIEQIKFFSLKDNRSAAIFIVFVIGCVLYLIPLLNVLIKTADL